MEAKCGETEMRRKGSPKREPDVELTDFNPDGICGL
jgi:hypothetical protein